MRHIPATYDKEQNANAMIDDIKTAFNKLPITERKNSKIIIDEIWRISISCGATTRTNAREFLIAIQTEAAQSNDFSGSSLDEQLTEAISDLAGHF